MENKIFNILMAIVIGIIVGTLVLCIYMSVSNQQITSNGFEPNPARNTGASQNQNQNTEVDLTPNIEAMALIGSCEIRTYYDDKNNKVCYMTIANNVKSIFCTRR